MKKTMIYLDEDQFVLLKKTAALSKKKMSEIIRTALSNHLKRKRKKPNYFSFVGVARGPKKGRTSEQAEQVLKEVLISSS